MAAPQDRRILRLATFGATFVAAVIVVNALPPLGLFLIALPIHFHSLIFIALGLWCWAVNVHVLTLYGIDCNMLLGTGPATLPAGPDLPKSSTPSQTFLAQHVNDYRSLYRIAGSVSALVAAGVLAHEMLRPAVGQEGSNLIPGLIYIILLGTLLWPGTFFYPTERFKFLQSMARICTPLLFREVPFCDVILADILTSFSRILGDLHVTFCDLVLEPGTNLVSGSFGHLAPRDLPTNRSQLTTRAVRLPENQAGMRAPKVISEGPGTAAFWGFNDMIGPLIVSLPFLIRFRQCISEFLLSSNPAARRRHLANALKYCTSLPVIFFGTVVTYIQRRVHSHTVPASELPSVARSVDLAVELWIVASVVNAVYSLYWDVYVDWSLGHIRNPPVPPGSRVPRLRYFFLRPYLHFPSPYVYYLAILCDGAIRFAWFFKVYPLYKTLKAELANPDEHAHVGAQVFVGLDLTLKLLEVLRRWMWTFFRIEREWVEKPFYSPVSSDGPRSLSNEKERPSSEDEVPHIGVTDFGGPERNGGIPGRTSGSARNGEVLLDAGDVGRKARRTSWGESDGYGLAVNGIAVR